MQTMNPKEVLAWEYEWVKDCGRVPLGIVRACMPSEFAPIPDELRQVWAGVLARAEEAAALRDLVLKQQDIFKRLEQEQASLERQKRLKGKR